MKLTTYEFLDACRDGGFDLIENALYDVNITDSLGRTGLIIAAYNGHLNIVEKLIERAPPGGADINFQSRQGKTALISASSLGYTDIVNVLIKNGAHIDLTDKLGRNALNFASAENYVETMFLLENKTVNHKDENGDTLLIKAVKDQNVKYILYLYSKGADFYIENNLEVSALDMLMDYNRPPTILVSLMEKLILNKTIEIDENEALSL